MVALAVRLGPAGERLPEPALYRPPAPLTLAKPPPFVVLDGRLPSAAARIRLALAAFAKGLMRDDLNPT